MENKTLDLNVGLYKYLLSINPEESLELTALRQQCLSLDMRYMMSTPEQISFIIFLIKLLKPVTLLEIGTFTGYATLAMAQASSDNAKIFTCDIDKSWTRIAHEHWHKAGVADKIELHLGSALETLNQYEKENITFDFIFIDADKINYIAYLKHALNQLNKDGIILVDNVLWGGKVADKCCNDFQTNAIREFNEYVLSLNDINSCVLPLADGLTMISKK